MDSTKISDTLKFSYGFYILVLTGLFFWFNGDMWEHDVYGNTVHLTKYQTLARYISSITLCAVLGWVPYYLYKTTRTEKFPLLMPLTFIAFAGVLIFSFTYVDRDMAKNRKDDRANKIVNGE